MKNKRLFILISLLLSLTVFWGCNNETKVGTQGEGNVNQEAKDETGEDTSNKQDETTNSEEETNNEDTEPAIVLDKVILDNEIAKITLIDITKTDIKVEIENKSSEEIYVDLTGLAINGIMRNVTDSLDILAGKKSINTIALKSLESDKLANIEGAFRVYSTEYEEDSEVHTFEILKDNSIKPEPESEGKVLVDNENVKIIFIKKFINDVKRPQLDFEVINKMDDNINVYISILDVDDYMVEEGVSEYILKDI